MCGRTSALFVDSKIKTPFAVLFADPIITPAPDSDTDNGTSEAVLPASERSFQLPIFLQITFHDEQ